MQELEKLKQYITGEIPPHFKIAPGEEAYSFYCDLALKHDHIQIADLGTYQGLSALALSINDRNTVFSYDIDLNYNIVRDKKNIQFIQKDIFDDLDRILKCPIILIDIDPHDGIQEKMFFDKLIELGFKGMTIWDDINTMTLFWQYVKKFADKVDISEEKGGHHSGTGIIIFN